MFFNLWIESHYRKRQKENYSFRMLRFYEKIQRVPFNFKKDAVGKDGRAGADSKKSFVPS